MARRGAVDVGADFSEAGYALGVISGMAKEVRTNRYLGDVITYVHSELAGLFDEHMDFAVDAAPQRFSHVYEWNPRAGSDRKEDRLWNHKLLGSGGKRNATFTWRASVKPIPTPQERKNNPNDPMSEVSDEDIARLSKRRYVFYWKAPIMEYNQPVNITPKYAKALFIPTGDPTNPFVFANEFRNLQPGGEQNTGQFTAEWTAWWGTMAPTYFEKYIQEGLEKDLAGVETGIRSGQRARSGKKLSLGVKSNYAAAFESGEEWAQMYMDKHSRKYKGRSKR